MIVISRTPDGTEIRAPAGVFPPRGATTASFVLLGALGALLAMIYAAGEWWHLSGGFGFPTDAAWTRAVFARNLAEGRGLCFNPGVAVAGAPGPAWLAMLAAGGYLLGDFVGGAKLLGVWAVVLTAYLVWMITLDLLSDWRFAFLAALTTVAAPHFLAAGLGGTESALGALLLAATIRWQARSWDGARGQRLGLALACGLGALCRPELALLVPAVLLDRVLVTAVRGKAGGRMRAILAGGLPEALGAAALAIPYLIYNWNVGGALWQQPGLALRGQSVFAWSVTALKLLWTSSPLVLAASVLGLPVAVLSAARPRSDHSSFLLVLLPIALLSAPGLIWRDASAANGAYTAACLTPAICVLGSAGLFALYRTANSLRLRNRPSLGKNLSFALGITAVVCALGVLGWFSHRAAWLQYGVAVKKVSDLQGAVGRWAAQHLAPDASIASREVGAIGFYSRRRVLDLGGTIDQVGYLALSRPGPPDDNLLAFLQKTKPSHVAMRPADFPYLAQRTDILAPVVTCVVRDEIAGGASTMTLYETPWPPPSVRAVQINTRRR